MEPIFSKTLKENTSVLTNNKDASEADADALLHPIIEHLNHNLSILATGLQPKLAQHVIYRIWIDTVLRLLVHYLGPLSYYPDSSPTGNSLLKSSLDSRQVGLIKHWLKLLVSFFHAGGEGLGLPQDILEKGSYFYVECQTLIQYAKFDTSELVQIAQQLCVKDAPPGRWSLYRLLRGRTLWDSSNNTEAVKAALTSLSSRREELLAANLIVL